MNPQVDRAAGAGNEPPAVPEATAGRYARGIGWQAIGRVGYALAAFGILLAVAGELDLGPVGIFDSYLALYALLDVLVDGGSGLALVRRTSEAPRRLPATLRVALRFRFLSAGVAFVIAAIYQSLDPQVGAGNLWGWLTALTLFGHVPSTFGVLYHTQLQFKLPSIARCITGVASLAAVLLAVLAFGSRDPMLLVFLALASRPASNILIWLGARRLLANYREATEPAVAGFVRESLTLGAGGVLREAYARLDVLMLRWLLGSEIAGLYAPARRAVNLAVMLPSFVLTVAMPPMAAEAASDLAAFGRRSWQLAARLTLFALPATLLCLPLIPWYLSWFDTEYAAAADALRLLAFAAMLAYPGMVCLTAVISAGAARAALWLSLLGLVVNLVGNLALIPSMDLAGAGVARLAAELAALAGAAYALKRLVSSGSKGSPAAGDG